MTEAVTNQSNTEADHKKAVTISRVLVASMEKETLDGEDVAAVHAALIEKNLHVGTDSKKSIYGAATALAVRHFQAQSGLNVDGKVGKETAVALGLTWKEPTEK